MKRKSNKTVAELMREQELTDLQREAARVSYVTVEYGKLWIEDSCSCCEPMGSELSDVNGICPDCDTPTVDGEAATGCQHSPVCCETCGWKGCDGSC